VSWGRVVPAVLLFLALCGRVSSAKAQKPGDTHDTLQVEFLDVGQADAILIKLGHRAVLVDASRGDDIVQYLEEEGIDSLVAAIVSHNHDDHIGGMDAVLYSYPVALYLSNGRAPENQNSLNVAQLVAEKKIPHPSAPWAPILLGDVRITVFPSSLPPGEPDENNHSLGVLVERGKFKALMTGDSQREELSGWLKTRKIPDVDVLKAAHHGSRNGVIPGWLNATRPEIVVISVGANNGYGHPDSMALRYYGVHNRRVLRTDRDGTVVVSVDGEGKYSVTTRGPLPR
jgi:beta-lactamase superfamily II metal-dependent hydrolase